MADIQSLRKRLIEKAKTQIVEKYSGRDAHIIRAVNVLEDLDSIFNLLTEQLKEWHGMNFPELDNLMDDNEKYVQLVAKLGERKNFEEKKVEETVKNNEVAKKIDYAAKNSIGSEIGKNDLDEISKLANNALAIRKERAELESYVNKEMSALCPHSAKLAGSVIGAKMIAKAGSLKRLAMMPSSTIQIIGAEKALFAHLREGAKSPKYGILYQHPTVKAAKKEEKGKVARKLAGKLAIAIRQDYFGKNK